MALWTVERYNVFDSGSQATEKNLDYYIEGIQKRKARLKKKKSDSGKNNTNEVKINGTDNEVTKNKASLNNSDEHFELIDARDKYNVFESGKRDKRRIMDKFMEKIQRRKASLSGDLSADRSASNVEESVPGESGEPERGDKFTLIGRLEVAKQAGVKAHLPGWLARPTVISTDLKSKFEVSNIQMLDKSLIDKLKENNIEYFFPVQQEVIPWLLKDVNKKTRLFPPCDVCVSAPTGSGKTLTYVLPIIQSLSRRHEPKIRALVIVPVQSLAVQVAEVFTTYCKGTCLKVESTVGGRCSLDVEQRNLVKLLPNGNYDSLIDILVTTPGRLVEHLEHTKGFTLKHLRFLVIDEADRMIDKMQNDWLFHLDRHLDPLSRNATLSFTFDDLRRRQLPQKLLFSATLTQDPEILKQLNLFQPKLFTTQVCHNVEVKSKKADYTGAVTTPAELKEKYIVVEAVMKPLVVVHLLEKGWRHVLCFTKSAEDAYKLSKLLSFMNKNLNISDISSKFTSEQREDILNKFASGQIDMLVSSDVMARGIDIRTVKYVISYDPAKHVKTYIHRAGRTGRAGSRGTALTIVSPSQVNLFTDLLHQMNKTRVKLLEVDEEEMKRRMDTYREAHRLLKDELEREQTERSEKLKQMKGKPRRLNRIRRRKKKANNNN